MKDKLFPIFMSIKQNKIQAFNYSKTKSEAVCFNLIEIPDTPCTVVTVTVLKGRKKRIALDYVSFAKLMNRLERKFADLREESSMDESEEFYPYMFGSHTKELSKSWFYSLKCHRLFLIPTTEVFRTLDVLTNDNLGHILEFECGVTELSFYVNTKTHNLKLSRFSKEE